MEVYNPDTAVMYIGIELSKWIADGGIQISYSWSQNVKINKGRYLEWSMW